MIIELPERFYKEFGEYGGYAKVENGILELQCPWEFEKLMVELAYALKGRTKCCYCYREVEPNKITIDHLFPLNFGGVTITNNLEPACGSCNSSKSNLNQYEYKIWRTLSTQEEKKSFYKNTVRNKRRRKINPKIKNGFDLPKKWSEYWRLDKIQKITKVDNRGSDKYKRMYTFVSRYGKLPRPIIVSAKGVLLDGETAYAVAKELKFKEVPVIVLENVRVVRN